MKEWKNRRVLVTGGAGFIGSALVWALNKRGCQEIVIADFLGTSEKWRNLVPLRFDSYLEADGLLSKLASGNLGKFDHILHMGACSSTTERNMEYLIHNNYEFTRELASWAQKNNARFVYASSAATYGDGSLGMSDIDTDLGKLRPLNAYGYSKHLFDSFADRRGLLSEIVGLKYFNIFGPNEGHKEEMRSLVNKSFSQIQKSGVIRLFRSYRPDYADGEQKRDFLYIKDAVEMTLHLAESDATGLYNIGGGEAHTWNELAGAVFAALGRTTNIAYIDMPSELREKYQYFTQADIAKLRATGYMSAITPLSEAVRDYVQNYLVTGRHLGDETGTA